MARFKNPFTDFDFSKIAGEFKLPTVNVETFVETARKNFAAMTTANTAAVEIDEDHRAAPGRHDPRRDGRLLQARQRRALRRHRRGEDAKQIDFAKKSYEPAIANTKELAELYSKGQTEASRP